MKLTTWIGTLLLASAGNVAAMSVEFDLLDPVSIEGRRGSFAEALDYEEQGLGLRVTGWSSGGSSYNPLADITRTKIGARKNGLGVERRGGKAAAIDNRGLDFDFLMFEFDREVSLTSVGLGFAPHYSDTDVSLAAINEMDVWSVDNIYDAERGANQVSLSASSATWVIGAFHPAFGFAQDFAWDSFRIDQISVDVNAVPLPAAFWFFLTGMGALGYFRRKAHA
ncbi:MAG: VPLPA-CTERM sorting domain-containing protein [Agarilytica sp.]